MAHRYTPRDVERSLQRYRDLTGDAAATLQIDDGALPGTRQQTAVFQVTGSDDLRGFVAYGALGAHLNLEWFCNGIEVGRRPKKKPR